MNRVIISIFTIMLFSSCKETVFPKPTGYLRLAHQKETYQKIKTDCPFEFETNTNTKLLVNDKCWIKIKYPKLKATIDLTYRPINNNLRELLLESEKLTIKHAVKADKISSPILFDNFENSVFGSIREVVGNAASSIQFNLTDSTKHFITGAVYFNVQPNYDSIYPSIKYIEKDIKYLIETTRWKD